MLQYRSNENSVIFSLINGDKKSFKLKCLDATKAIYCSCVHGPWFGHIPANSNQNTNSSGIAVTNCVYKHLFYANNLLEAGSILALDHNISKY
jgi:hypothetical protein